MTTPQQLQAARKISTYLSNPDIALLHRTRTLLQEALAALDPELSPLEGVDVVNRFLIATTGSGDSQLLNFTLRPSPMRRDDALVVAAWLVTLADPLHERFPAIEMAVRNT